MYGCAGASQSASVGADLDHPSEVHHRHVVGDVADDREVVRDQEQPDVELAREALEEVRELRLRRRVERRERLVEDDHRRIGGERAGDRDPLPLPARELVREAVEGVRGQADELEQLAHPRVPLISPGMPSATWLPIVRRGLSDEYGFWKTSWSRTSSAGRARRPSEVTGRPSKVTVPLVVSTRPTAARASVDFPQPDSPTRPTIRAALDRETRAGDRAHAAAAAVVVDDDVVQLERAHAPANGST